MGGGNAIVLGVLSVAVLAMVMALHIPLVGCSDFNTNTELAHWSFDGTFNDVSAARRGPATVVDGSKVALAVDNDISSEIGRGGYVRIRRPGYLNLPAVRIYDTSFTITFTLRIPSSPSSRQALFADWSVGQWQFISMLYSNSIALSLRRNMDTNGADPEQGLLDISASNVPVGAWFDVAFQFDRQARTAKLFLDQKLVATSVVRYSVADVTMKASTSPVYQFGRKADETGDGWALDADLRNLRIFGSALAP